MKKCKQGYYYCHKDKKCKKIPLGYRVGLGGWLRRENDEESEDKKKNGNGNGNHSNGNGNGNGGSNGGSNGGGVSESVISEKRDGKSAKDKGYSLRDWFKGGGWKQTGGKYDGKPCARQPGQKTKPFCRDADDRAAMSKDERNRRAAKKRREDPNPDRKGKAKMVSEGKKDACYHKVKSRYSVWPSAYASGALVKCRKVGAKNWGNKTKKEGYDYSNWRDDFKALQIDSFDIIKPEPLQATDGIGSRMLDEAKKCWKGYKKVGTQKLFGKTYNRCVKEGNKSFGQFMEDWQKVNKGDKTDGMSQKAVNAYKRENPGSKLQTAVTEKKPTGKRAKRRTSFCARSKGQKDMHNIDCTKTPDKAICKARKRWNC